MLKYSKKQKTILILFEIIFIIYAISLVYPFVWVLINSFKSNREFFQDIWSLPRKWEFLNYVKAWSDSGISGYLLNSIFITFFATLLGVMNAATPAYVIAKYKFRGSGIIYSAVVFAMLFPSVGSISALYKLMVNTGLYDSHPGLLLIYSGGLGFNFILLYAFFKSISWSYAEAAFMDGASDFQVFIHVMLPQAKAGLSAVALITSIGIWNDFYTPYMFLQSKGKFTVAVGLYQLVLEQRYAADWTTLFAAMIILVIPTIIVYLAFQDTLIDGMVTGGLKG